MSLAKGVINIAPRRLDPGLGAAAPSNLHLLIRVSCLVFAGGIALALLSGCMAQAKAQLDREARARKAESLGKV